MFLDNITSLNYFCPEFFITTGILAVLLIELLVKKKSKGSLVITVSILSIAGALISTLTLYGTESTMLFTGMVVLDPFSLFFKVLFIFAALFVIIFSINSYEVVKSIRTEYHCLILGVLLGLILMSSSVDLIMIYIGLEFTSISSYLLVGFLRDNKKSIEASLKYVLYGALSSGIMLFGISLLFGITGTTNLYDINKILTMSQTYPLAIFISMMFILVGIGYKIAFVPFHFWCPDVYEGAPTPITAFLSVGPKAAGFAMLIRVLFISFSDAPSGGAEWDAFTYVNWPFLIAVLSAVTMTLGNFSALHQKELKRLLAYSSIAHAGYLLMGITVLSEDGIKGILIYLVAYLFMNLGAFYIIIGLANKIKTSNLEAFAGMGWRAPFVSFAMVVFLISLTGLPPTVGFIGKFFIFSEVIHSKIYWLAVVGALNTAVSLYYYVLIFKKMWLEKPVEKMPISISPLNTVVTFLLVVPTLLFGIFFDPLLRFSEFSSKIFWGH